MTTYTPETFENVQMQPGERYRITFAVPSNLSQDSRARAARTVELAIINSKQFRHVQSGFTADGQEYYEIVEVRAPQISGVGIAPVVVWVAGVALVSLIAGLLIAFQPKTIERLANAATIATFPVMIIALAVVAMVFAPELKTLLRGK